MNERYGHQFNEQRPPAPVADARGSFYGAFYFYFYFSWQTAAGCNAPTRVGGD